VKGGDFAKCAQKLISVLLTTDTGGEVHLRVPRTRLRQREFSSLFEGRRRCGETAVVCDRLFDELIDGIGTEQSPPIALDLSAEGNVVAGYRSRSRLRRAGYPLYSAQPAEP